MKKSFFIFIILIQFLGACASQRDAIIPSDVIVQKNPKFNEKIKFLESRLNNRLNKSNSDHLEIASILNDLGTLWYNREHFEKAIENFKSALISHQISYGSNHPELAKDWDNLGKAYMGKAELYSFTHDVFVGPCECYDLGNKAIEHFNKARDIRIINFGKDHIDLAKSWDYLGSAWMFMGEYKKAQEFFEKALATRIKIFGPNHPEVADSWDNLGILEVQQNIYKADQDKFKQAQKYYEKALDIRITTYGPDHQEIAKSWDKLGSTYDRGSRFYKRQSDVIDGPLDYKKASAYYEKSLAIRKKIFGVNHPETAKSFEALGRMWIWSYEKTRKEIDYFEKVLEIRIKLYGLDHPKVARVWRRLGWIWTHYDIDKALDYLEKVSPVFLENYGPDHPEVILNWGNLGWRWRDEKNNYDKGIEYFEKVLASYLKIYGPKHPLTKDHWKTMESMWKYGTGNYDKVIKEYEKVLPKINKNYRPKNPDGFDVSDRWNEMEKIK